jgi:CubicO group peptidase (beta-lactamase class C family)
MSSDIKSVDQTIKMPSGSIFNAPATWQNEAYKNYIRLIGPENDLSIYFIELPILESLEKTAVAAWQQIQPNFDLKPSQEVFPPTNGKWEKVYDVLYETPASESRFIGALICSFNNVAYACLLDGTMAGVSRRGVEMMAMVASWKPIGSKEEASINENKTHVWTDKDVQNFEDFIYDAMQKLQVPGVSISIVQSDGKNLYSKAFGVKQIGNSEPVTLDTPFMIGSVTKPLTTLLMAMLIDQKKLSWETPVTSILQDFSLAEADITQKLLIRHTVSASTGMPRRDLDWIFKYKNITPEDRLLEMKHMAPTTGFGETFQYSNYLVMAGGYAAARAFTPHGNLEDAYSLAMQQLVFEPLKMKKTVLKSTDAIELGAALPHGINFDGKLCETPVNLEEACYSIAPSGAIWSTVEDLSKYILTELNMGVLDGKRLVSQPSILERRKKGIKITEKIFYALGLVIEEEQGLTIVSHDGITIGFSSGLCFLPEKGIGLVILTNTRLANAFILAVRQKFLELTFSAKKRSDETVNFAVTAQQTLLKNNQEVSFDFEDTKWIESLVGNYQSDVLGHAKILRSADERDYIIEFEEWQTRLGSKTEINGEKTLILVDDPFPGMIKLQIENNGNSLAINWGQDKYSFSRI